MIKVGIFPRCSSPMRFQRPRDYLVPPALELLVYASGLPGPCSGSLLLWLESRWTSPDEALQREEDDMVGWTRDMGNVADLGGL